ncbi:MAG: hypothetical protein QOJ65_1260 [Fimbriimonadaceae bacterium]|nr:hypothetical protein [Fimbriimonadaceae bacterium]
MQNFSSNPQDSLSAQEAHEVLSAWANRPQASGVDPNVQSVQALAAGLGVSEDEVRRMVEDVRVQHRSHQIAAGILAKENVTRRRLDVTAAIGASIAIILVAIAVTAYFVWGGARGGAAAAEASAILPPPTPIAGTPAPAFAPADGVHVGNDGFTIYENGKEIFVSGPDGVTIQKINIEKNLAEVDKKIAKIEAQRIKNELKLRAVETATTRADNRQARIDEIKAQLDENEAEKQDLLAKRRELENDRSTPPPSGR